MAWTEPRFEINTLLSEDMPLTTIRPELQDILNQALAGEPIRREQALWLVREIDPASPENQALMRLADQLTRASSSNRAEIHAQIGVNVAPCPYRCGFCSFAAQAGLFRERVELSAERVALRAGEMVSEGANVIYLMTTGNYDFDRFLHVAAVVRANIPAEIPLVANTGDIGRHQAQQLAAVGFQAAYHVVRLDEGQDTAIRPEKRRATMQAIVEAGLRLAYCVEPIGPEHTAEEIVYKIFLGKQFRVWFSGAMRRIPVAGTPLAHRGMISELELAKVVAVTRLVMGNTVRAHCTHEPNSPSLLAGANLIWAESGSNPRDSKEETARARGWTPADCARLLRQAGYAVHAGAPASLTELRVA